MFEMLISRAFIRHAEAFGRILRKLKQPKALTLVVRNLPFKGYRRSAENCLSSFDHRDFS